MKRFSVSLEKDLVEKFDKEIKNRNYPTRSKAIGDLIREFLVQREWSEGKDIAGTITLVYNHHKRELVNKLIDIQHDFSSIVVSSSHIHFDDDNCLEVIIVRGRAKEIEKFSNILKATKGVKYCSLNRATIGKDI